MDLWMCQKLSIIILFLNPGHAETVKNTKCIIHHPKPEIFGYQSSSNNMNREYGILTVSSPAFNGTGRKLTKKLYPENLVGPVKI